MKGMEMMRMHTTLVLSLLFLTATGMMVFAQGGKDGAVPPTAKPAGGDAASVFSGKSVNANLQEALNDALQKAQLTLTKTVADAQFNYQVDTITGKRGGFAGTNEITLNIKILR
jgi:hypothetical protein